MPGNTVRSGIEDKFYLYNARNSKNNLATLRFLLTNAGLSGFNNFSLYNFLNEIFTTNYYIPIGRNIINSNVYKGIHRMVSVPHALVNGVVNVDNDTAIRLASQFTNNNSKSIDASIQSALLDLIQNYFFHDRNCFELQKNMLTDQYGSDISEWEDWMWFLYPTPSRLGAVFDKLYTDMPKRLSYFQILFNHIMSVYHLILYERTAHTLDNNSTMAESIELNRGNERFAIYLPTPNQQPVEYRIRDSDGDELRDPLLMMTQYGDLGRQLSNPTLYRYYHDHLYLLLNKLDSSQTLRHTLRRV
jgi:hypothetical protein